MIIVTVLVVVAGVVVAVAPRVHRAPALDPGTSPQAIDIDEVARPPVVGTGPLQRVVRVVRRGDQLTAVDPFSGETFGTIARAAAPGIADAEYAVQRYGYSAAAKRTISLTFDDGPDPVYTPRLLDLLSAKGVPATFCVVGEAAAEHRDIMRRIAREGHELCNHSYSHADLNAVSGFAAREELVITDRVIRATAGVGVGIVRPPYNGAAVATIQDTVQSVLRAQQWGYLVAGYDFDSVDWKHALDGTPIPLPPLTGANTTILLHDAGGDRTATLAYVERLIDTARDRGYTFHTMAQVSPQLAQANQPVRPSVWDHVALWGAVVWSMGTRLLLEALFFLVVAVVVGVGLFNVTVAAVRRLRQREPVPVPTGPDAPLVSVVIAAFNEEMVITRTLDTLRASHYRKLDIVVVDDGSSDRTAQLVAEAARTDDRIRLVRQHNQGKSTALNRALEMVRSDVVVTLDADTLVTPDTVGNLVRHFTRDGSETLAAVAGVIKAGNLPNLLTRWQALEYLVQIGVDRAAQTALNAVMIVPGACAAWRRGAVLAAGGFSEETLAEDCDLSLNLHRQGYRITQDDHAVAYTEVPETLAALVKQRLRWTFGNLQVLWKHRSMMLRARYRWLGLVVLPLAAMSLLSSVVFTPFIYLMAFLAVRAHGWEVVAGYLMLFTVVHLVFAAVGVWLMRERPFHLLMVPIHRLIQEPLRVYLVYMSVPTALRGTRLGWNKLQRTGTAIAGGIPGRLRMPSARVLRRRPALVSTVLFGRPAEHSATTSTTSTASAAATSTVDQADPPGGAPAKGRRDRYLDSLRAVALCRVVAYHTFGFAFFSFVFPSIGVMLGLAGSLMARSLDRSAGAGATVHSRMRRLLPPLWLLGLVWVPLMLLQGWTATSGLARPFSWQELAWWIVPVFDPPGSDWGIQVTAVLWYLRTYFWLVLLAPAALWAFRRWPARTLLAPFVVVALAGTDLLGLDGLTGSAVLDVATYGGCWLLGYAHHDGLIRRLRRPALVSVAAVFLAAGGGWALANPTNGGYDLNDIPLAQALWSFGFVLVLLRFRPTMAWLDRVPVLRWLVNVLNARAVTVYLWHEVALMASVPVMVALAVGNAGVQFALVWALVAVAVLAVGWVEDVAARRAPRLLPGVALPRLHRPVPRHAGRARIRLSIPSTRRRLVLGATGVAATAALLTVVAVVPTSRPAESDETTRGRRTLGATSRWLDRHVSAADRVLMEHDVWISLNAADLVPAVEMYDATHLPPLRRPAAEAERGHDYVVASGPNRDVAEVIQEMGVERGAAVTVASFGRGPGRIEIGRLATSGTGVDGGLDEWGPAEDVVAGGGPRVTGAGPRERAVF